MDDSIKNICKVLKENPNIYYTDRFYELRTIVDSIKCDEKSDDEEEAPPEFMETKADKIRKLVDEAKVCIQEQNYDLGLKKCNDALIENSDSVKSLRSRSFIYSKKFMYKEAYEDICKAQSIDFSEEFVSFQDDMKSHISNDRSQKNQINDSGNATRNDSGIHPNMNLQDLLNNDQFREIANNMMSDPQFMQTMNNMWPMFAGSNSKQKS